MEHWLLQAAMFFLAVVLALVALSIMRAHNFDLVGRIAGVLDMKAAPTAPTAPAGGAP